MCARGTGRTATGAEEVAVDAVRVPGKVPASVDASDEDHSGDAPITALHTIATSAVASGLGPCDARNSST
jgi:hypothetical protein